MDSTILWTCCGLAVTPLDSDMLGVKRDFVWAARPGFQWQHAGTQWCLLGDFKGDTAVDMRLEMKVAS